MWVTAIEGVDSPVHGVAKDIAGKHYRAERLNEQQRCATDKDGAFQPAALSAGRCPDSQAVDDEQSHEENEEAELQKVDALQWHALLEPQDYWEKLVSETRLGWSQPRSEYKQRRVERQRCPGRHGQPNPAQLVQCTGFTGFGD